MTYFLDKKFVGTTHWLVFTGMKSVGNDGHIAVSGFYRGAIKTYMNMVIYKKLSCDGEKCLVMKEQHTLYIGECVLNKNNVIVCYSICYSI